MKNIKSFKRTLYLLRNAEHEEFHRTIILYNNELIASVALLDHPRTAYLAAFEKEDQAFILYRQVSDTNKIMQIDRRRDEIYSALKNAVKSAIRHPHAEKRTAGRALKELIDQYKDADRKPLIENSAYIQALIEDMRLPENLPHVATLGLADLLAHLSAANEAFRKAYDERGEWIFEKRACGSIKDVRRATDAAFDALCSAVNALYQVSLLSMNDESLHQTLAAIIDSVNNTIFSLQRIYDLRTP